jgi:PLD-like domain
MKHATPQRTLIAQPDDGIDAVLRLVTAATKSLRIKQFTVSEPHLVQAIIDAHHCGVAVRVMLNPHRSSGDRPNDLTFAQLQKTGMAVQWTSPDFVVTHEKSIVVDESRALIATFNLVLKYWLIGSFGERGMGLLSALVGLGSRVTCDFRGGKYTGTTAPRGALPLCLRVS